ncbi:MAG: ATP-binding cassette domain-containing protein [Gammaproteobacteria bacterium]|jgi:oligopeptide/dipeptide ABC transporter ATP-binding protein|nr:ATP-binding cassette domain-containing protein [Gammaproteobacteria bacterium]
MTAPLLQVDDLRVEFDTYGGTVQAVRGVTFGVDAGQTLAIVGESGCGKSVTVQSIMGLTPMPPGRITSGRARLRGVDILGRTEIDGRDIRGREIGMIFQDPMTSLNPTMTIGDQIAETLEVHRGWSRKRAFARAVELLEMARIPEATTRAKQYPFEFSGGMLQRAMIAMAIACEPAILIADEPTTALDVTIQAQVLDLMGDLQRDIGMAIVLITHDLGVVARMADEVVVMYAGQVAEKGSVDDIFYRSAHPYTLGLRAAMPSNDPAPPGGGAAEHRLMPIEGSPPDLFDPPKGCAYAARCPYAMQVCAQEDPHQFFQGEHHFARCWLHHEDAPEVAELYHGEGPHDGASGSRPGGRSHGDSGPEPEARS